MASGTGASFSRVTDPRSPVFAEILALYANAFPSSERKPTQFLSDVLVREDYRIFMLADQESLIGFGVIFQSSNQQFALLEYMAIADRRRDQGWGARLFNEVTARVAGPLLLEVETDRLHVAGTDDRARRKSFYRRLGCHVIEGLDYLMPQISSSAPPSMDLMIHGYPKPFLEKELLREWLGEIYRKVYDRHAHDSAIGRMLADLPKEIRLN